MEFLQKFKLYLLALKPAPSSITVKNYCLDVKHFLVWLESKGETLQAHDVSLVDIHAFADDKKEQLSARSLERHMSSLRKFFHFLKLNGDIAVSPFEAPAQASHQSADPYHLREFKDYLYVYNAASLTIKNYIIDVKQFFKWAEIVLHTAGTLPFGENNVLPYVNNDLLEQYRDRLASEHAFSYASINRKLSSLRKYFAWAKSQNLLRDEIGLQINPNAIANVSSTPAEQVTNVATAQEQDVTSLRATAQVPTPSQEVAAQTIEKPAQYSKFPPLRLIQKITKGINYIADETIISPLAHMALGAKKTLWVLRGKPIFTKNHGSFSQKFMQVKAVKNISKAIYNPENISLASFPWYRKAWHTLRYQRPNWYKRYHSYALVHYFNWAILIIFTTAIGFGFYNSFVQKPTGDQHLLAAAQPNRILSFQGRLTDSSNNPIITATNLRFGIYTDATSTGSALLWQEVDNVTPDSNGVFSVLLGKNSTIQQSLFANNSNLYLGVTVGTTSELTPRQQLATVAYATNAETLQGLPPITQAGAGTQNVVLALDSTGNLTIGAASKFQTVGGAFTLSGDTLALNTTAGTNGNISLAPDGTGFIDLQKPLINTTNNNNISSAQGSVEVDDTFAILATSSGIPAVTINQNGAGTLFTASAGGISKFTIANSGSITDTNYTTAGGIFYADATGLLLQTTAGTSSQCLVGGSTPSWGTCGSGATNYWTLASGALYPVNTTLDVLFGGTSSSSANFAFINNSGTGTPTASVSGNLTLNSAGVIQTTNNQLLTIGGNTTGAVSLGSNIASGILPKTTNAYDLGSLTQQWNNIYGNNIYSNGQLLTQDWQRNLGVLSPLNITNDLAIGGTATSTAKFQVFGLSGNATTAGTLTFAGGSANNVIAARSNAGLTIGDSQTGNISFGANSTLIAQKYTTQNGLLYISDTTGTIAETAQGAAHTLLHGNGTGAPTFSAVDLTTDVTGILPLTNGGTNNSLTADNGGIVYSDASKLQILAHSISAGECLLSGGAAAPYWSSCSTAASNWWNETNGALYPINTTFDFLLGGSSTGSAKFSVLNMSGAGTPTASVSAGTTGATYITGDGTLQTTNYQGLTLGGPTTGNITLAPQNSVAGSSVHINAATIDDSFNTANLFGTATTLTFASGATTLTIGSNTGTTTFASDVNSSKATLTLLATPTTVNVGSSTQTDNLLGNVALGSSQSNTITPNGLMNADLIPTGNGAINMGSSSHYYNTIYANNFVAPVSGGTSGFWSLANDVIYPVNTYFDLAIGGTATSSADWQVYSENVGSIVAGTATSSGNLTFRGTAIGGTTYLNLLRGNSLNVRSSIGGDAGLTSILTIGNNGDIAQAGNYTTTGNVAVNGGTISTTNSTASLFETGASTINFGTTATSGINIGNASGSNLIRGNLTIGSAGTNTVDVLGKFISDLSPNTSNTYDLGTSSLEWRNLYLSGTYGGFVQRNLGVVSPTNITDDLTIGGISTASAKFQIFANTGNATTAGDLTFAGGSANNVIAARNNAGLTIGDSQTGNVVFTGNGNVGIGTSNPTSALSVQSASSLSIPAINLTTSTNLGTDSQYMSFDSNRFNLGWNGTNGFGFLQVNPGKDLELQTNCSTVSCTNPDLFISRNSYVGINTTSTGNAQFAINQSGLGDVFTASAAGTTLFTIANDGSIKNSLVPNLIGATGIDTLYNLGAASAEWDTLYVRQIVTPSSGGIAGFWQLTNSGVLVPANITNDLTVGLNGTITNLNTQATSSANFHVFANTGTASTAGSLTFTGLNVSSAASVNLLNNSTLGFYNSVGGDAGLSANPALYVANSGYIGINTNNPSSPLTINYDNSTTPGITVGGGTNVANFISLSGTRAMVGYDGTQAALKSGSGHGLSLFVNATSFSSGTQAEFINSSGYIGLGTTAQGNGQVAINQAGLGDILSASASGNTQFVLNNNGYLGLGPNMKTAQGILDVASGGPTFPSDLTLQQTSTTNLVTNPSFEYSGNPLNGWLAGGGAAAQYQASNPATESALFGAEAVRFYNPTPTATNFYFYSNCITASASAQYAASSYVNLSSNYSGTSIMRVMEYTSADCSTGNTVTQTITAANTTNTWQRLTTAFTTASTTLSMKVLWGNLAASGQAYADGFQVEQSSTVSPYADGSLGPGYYWTGASNNSTSVRLAGSAFAYDSVNSANGIGAASRAQFPTLQLDQAGTGDIIAASAAGSLQFKVSNSGVVTAHSFHDLDNTAYFLDPAATDLSLTTAGSVVIGATSNLVSGIPLYVAQTQSNASAPYTDANTGVYVKNTTAGAYATIKLYGTPTSTVSNNAIVFGGVSTSDILQIEPRFTTTAGTGINILGDGKVGIGTTTPLAALHVASTPVLFGNNVSGDSGSFGARYVDFLDTTRTSGGYIDYGYAASTYNAGELYFSYSASGSSSNYTSLGLYGSTTRLAVLGNGSVDLNTTTPSDGITVNGLPGTGYGQFRMINGNYGFFLRNDGGSTYFMHTASGNQYGGWNNDRQIILPDSSDDVYLANNGGTVGVGVTNTSSYGFEVSHANYTTYSYTPSVCLYCKPNLETVGSSAGEYYLNYWQENEAATSNHYFLIARAASGSYNALYINGLGNLYNANGVYGSLSDARLKTNVQPVSAQNSLAATLQLQPINYTWNALHGGDMTTEQIGFIAQKVQPVYPYAVSLNDGYYNVDYSRFTPLLVGAVQQLNTNIATSTANLTLTQTGDINLAAASPSANFNTPTYYTLSDVLGNPISQMGAMAEMVVGNLRVGSVQAQQTLTNTLAIATNNVSIAGQSLDSYIVTVVQNALNSGILSSPTISPIAAVDQIHANLISPLASNSAIALDLTGSKFTIRNNATGSAVATIDNTGNATFSGTLNSQNLAVNGDATISGTLHADKIEANQIAGLQEVVGTLSAQNITNVTNIYFATPSGTPTGENFATGYSASSTANFGLLAASTSGSLAPYMGYTNIASYSGFLAYVPNLSASTALFNQGLVSLGTTALGDTTVTGQLAIGAQLILANNSINVLGSSFEIQPLRQGGVNFEGGLLAIDTDGNLTVNGNAVFSKTLAANIISPISNNQDLTVQLGQNPTATGSALATSNLTVENASGSGVFAINQLGDVVASGTATISKLNFNFVQPALALSATEVVATGSAGTATIAAHQVEITIDNRLVTSKSLIYITPVGQSTVTPYLLRQVNGTSFTVGIPVQQMNGTTFNWLIVN